MSVKIFRALTRFLVRRDRHLAAEQERATVRSYVSGPRRSESSADLAELLDENGLARISAAGERFLLGTQVGDEGEAVFLERADVLAAHSVGYGATGMGKSVAWLLLLDQELRRMILREELGLPPDSAIWLDEPKHDIGPSFLALVEDRLRRTDERTREVILSRLTTFCPLGRYVVPFPLLTPGPGVSPELHATALSGLIGRLSGAPFGAKQRPMLDVIFLLLILERKLLLEGIELMGSWDRLRALGRRSTSPVVRGFFEENARAPSGSLDGIRARLIRLVFTPNLREMFESREGLDFDKLLRPGSINVMDSGGESGEEDLTSFCEGLIMIEFGRAIRRRQSGASSVIAVIDEYQHVLQGDGDVAGQTATLLEMARNRGVALHLLTQSPASVAAVSQRLLRSIHTNAAFEMLGATDDPSSLAEVLPVTGRRPRPPAAPWETAPTSPWLSRDEELRQLIEETRALPARHFWVRAKRRSPKAVLTKTLEFRLPVSLGDELARRVERGCLGREPGEQAGFGRRPRVTIVEGSPTPRRPRGL